MASGCFFQGFACLAHQPEQEDKRGHILGPPPSKERVQTYAKQHCACHVATGKELSASPRNAVLSRPVARRRLMRPRPGITRSAATEIAIPNSELSGWERDKSP